MFIVLVLPYNLHHWSHHTAIFTKKSDYPLHALHPKSNNKHTNLATSQDAQSFKAKESDISKVSLLAGLKISSKKPFVLIPASCVVSALPFRDTSVKLTVVSTNISFWISYSLQSCAWLSPFSLFQTNKCCQWKHKMHHILRDRLVLHSGKNVQHAGCLHSKWNGSCKPANS